MAHVDYERAWVALGERLRQKPGWGSKELHELMAEIAAECVVPENFVQKIVRLYGDSIHLSITTPETGAAVLDESELTAESKSPDPEASNAQRSDDEREGEAAGGPPNGNGQPRAQASARAGHGAGAPA